MTILRILGIILTSVGVLGALFAGYNAMTVSQRFYLTRAQEYAAQETAGTFLGITTLIAVIGLIMLILGATGAKKQKQ